MKNQIFGKKEDGSHGIISEEELPDPIIIPDPPFEVTKPVITADGTDQTVCIAHTAVPVDFFVDDGEITKVTVDPVAGKAELEISAVSAGKIEIYVTIDKQYSTTIFAQ